MWIHVFRSEPPHTMLFALNINPHPLKLKSLIYLLRNLQKTFWGNSGGADMKAWEILFRGLAFSSMLVI